MSGRVALVAGAVAGALAPLQLAGSVASRVLGAGKGLIVGAASEATGAMLDQRHRFDWSVVAASALGGGFASRSAGAFRNGLNSALANAGIQRILMATRLQKSFSVAAVAGAFAGGATAGWLQGLPAQAQAQPFGPQAQPNGMLLSGGADALGADINSDRTPIDFGMTEKIQKEMAAARDSLGISDDGSLQDGQLATDKWSTASYDPEARSIQASVTTARIQSAIGSIVAGAAIGGALESAARLLSGVPSFFGNYRTENEAVRAGFEEVSRRQDHDSYWNTSPDHKPEYTFGITGNQFGYQFTPPVRAADLSVHWNWLGIARTHNYESFGGQIYRDEGRNGFTLNEREYNDQMSIEIPGIRAYVKGPRGKILVDDPSRSRKMYFLADPASSNIDTSSDLLGNFRRAAPVAQAALNTVPYFVSHFKLPKLGTVFSDYELSDWGRMVVYGTPHWVESEAVMRGCAANVETVPWPKTTALSEIDGHLRNAVPIAQVLLNTVPYFISHFEQSKPGANVSGHAKPIGSKQPSSDPFRWLVYGPTDTDWQKAQGYARGGYWKTEDIAKPASPDTANPSDILGNFRYMGPVALLLLALQL